VTLAEQAQGGLVVATEVAGSTAPPPLSAANNSGEEQAVAEAAVSKVLSEPQVGAASGGEHIVMVSAEQTVPSPPPTRDHEAAMPATSKILVPATVLVGGGVTEALASGTWFAINFKVIDLDPTEIPSND
jgi:hypothetical protein